MKPAVDDETQAHILEHVHLLCAAGDRLHAANELEQAVAAFARALELLPPPYFQWEAATWILAALGDTYFAMRRFETARSAFRLALLCPSGAANPVLQMRLGQAHLECRDNERAMRALARAYVAGGDELFEGQDPKYLAVARSGWSRRAC
jgi:tetratricopeptide (TPR) repeat protein